MPRNRPNVAEGDMSLIKSFTVAEIESHLESLNENLHLTSQKVAEKCRSLINTLLNDQYAPPFAQPVDPVKFDLPDYFDVITKPMDLGTIKEKVDRGEYDDLEAISADIRLVFDNAILYNGEKSDVGGMAKTMLNIFAKELKNTMKQDNQMGRSSHLRNGETCILCGVARRTFEPIVLYCNGYCGMQKIRKNAAYYTDVKRENHYCLNCWNQISETEKITLADGSQVRKRALQKLKNDAINEEGWVCCDTCDGWVHQVCALFNGRVNKNNASYKCPKCHISDRKAAGKLDAPGKVKQAKDLPKCSLSTKLEQGVQKYLDGVYKKFAEDQNVAEDDIEKAMPFTIRVVSNLDKKHATRDEMQKRYKDMGFPVEFPVKTKCILLFQKVSGADVLIFGMYVYEYGDACPEPNRRRVYISYLDSVQYFQPRAYRTVVFQSVIVEYLRIVKDRGFHTAHIWSCPPAKGDDYIFHIHPENQRTPKAERLCHWYKTILEKARREGIVLDVRNMHETYFQAPVPKTPLEVPYFDGDYWVGEAENHIEQINKKERDRLEEVVKEDGTVELVGAVGTTTDRLMTKMGEAMEKMKANFLVAYLYTREFVEALEKGERWTIEDEKDAIRKYLDKRRSEIAEVRKKEQEELEKEEEEERKKKAKREEARLKAMLKAEAEANAENGEKGGGEGETEAGAKAKTKEEEEEKLAEEARMMAEEKERKAKLEKEKKEKAKRDKERKEREKKEKLQREKEVKQEEIEGEGAEKMTPKSPLGIKTTRNKIAGKKQPGKMKNILPATVKLLDDDDIDDDTGEILPFPILDDPTFLKSSKALGKRSSKTDETLDPDDHAASEIFDGRQQLLNYCQKNSTQFDQLRRAKHTTMMVLFQMHNPNAATFIPECGSCYNQITHGIRYRCMNCPDFSLCQDCYKPVITGLWAQRDARFSHDSNHRFKQINIEAEAKNAEERKRRMADYLKMMEHAVNCKSDRCKSMKNCRQMKDLMNHTRECKLRKSGNCSNCTKLGYIVNEHAKNCNLEDGVCKVPFCDEVKEKYRRLKMQQQQMDDRRRAAQNSHYGGDSGGGGGGLPSGGSTSRDEGGGGGRGGGGARRGTVGAANGQAARGGTKKKSKAISNKTGTSKVESGEANNTSKRKPRTKKK